MVDTIIFNLLLLKLSASFATASQCRPTESSLKNQKYFTKLSGWGDALPEEDIISSNSVHSEVECSLKCLQTTACVGYNYSPKSKTYAVNCQLSNKTQERGYEYDGTGKWKFYQDLDMVKKQNELPPDCEDSKPLGMENGKISDEQITSSSDWRSNHGPANGRLNFVASNGRTGSWSSGTSDVNQWLQVDFQRSTIITGISTQGRQDHYQFVKSYTISFSDDEKCFNEYKTGGTLKEFDGNSDQHSIVYHKISPAITAQFIRVHPTSWYGHISMRMEFYGCRN